MARSIVLSLAAAGVLLAGGTCVSAQDSPAAKATRKRLQTKLTVEYKEVGTKDVFDDLKREMDGKVAFKIDNNSGISNNAKLTYKANAKTLEQILNDLSDKYEFGYVVISNPKDKSDGAILIRKGKGKERGYEAGKEPKSGSEEQSQRDGKLDKNFIQRELRPLSRMWWHRPVAARL